MIEYTDTLLPKMYKNRSYTFINEINSSLNIDLDEKVILTTDSQGFRINTNQNIDFSNKKNFRIITVGGSTVLNDHVNDEYTWSNLLEKKLKINGLNTEIINTGINGLNSKHHYLTIKSFIKKDIDMAIILIGANDIIYHIKNQNNANSNFKIRFNAENSILYISIKNIRDYILSNFTNRKQIFDKINKIPRLNDKAFNKIIEYKTEKTSLYFRYYVSKIIQLCENKKIKCLFLNQPNMYTSDLNQAIKDLFWMAPMSIKDMSNIYDIYNKKINELDGKNVFSFDLNSKFGKEIKYFYDEIHFTKKGVNKLAEEVKNFILLNNIID